MVEISRKTKNIRILGITMFIIGIIITICAAAKVPEESATYPSTVNIFIGAIVFGIIGNILWHRSEKKVVKAYLEHHKNDTINNPEAILRATLPAIKQLQEKISKLNIEEICEELDNISENFVYPFTDKRKTFLDLQGKSKGSEVLLIVAYGERMINRTWSAASDGYRQEAESSLSEALSNYEKAIQKIS